MPLSVLSEHDETLEVLLGIHRDKRDNVVCTFVDASGTKISLRINPQAVVDLKTELARLIKEG